MNTKHASKSRIGTNLGVTDFHGYHCQRLVELAHLKHNYLPSRCPLINYFPLSCKEKLPLPIIPYDFLYIYSVIMSEIQNLIR